MKSRKMMVLLSIAILVLVFFSYLMSSNKLISPETDELTDIENELNGIDINSVDTDITLIENELN